MGRDRRKNNNGCCGCFGGCFFTLFALVMLVVLGCGGLYVFLSSNEPQPPFADYTPIASLATNFENKINRAASDAPRTRSLEITITDYEASSWLNLNAPTVSEDTFPMQNIQVTFRDGKVRVYGDLDMLGITSVGTEVVAILSNPDGKISVEIESAEVGGVALPASVRETIQDQIRETIDQELSTISGTYRITTISMSNTCLATPGSCLTIRGTIN